MVRAQAENEEIFADVASQLQDLVLASTDVEHFLRDLARYSADRLSSPEREVLCGVAVARKKKSTAIDASNPCLRVTEQLQNKHGDGPALAAMRTADVVLIADVGQEKRWPEYITALTGEGLRSVISLPFALGEEATGALSLYSSRPRHFSNKDIQIAQAFTAQVSKTLRLALQIGRLQDTRDGMSTAMKTRTVIDLATGAIMAQNRCSQHDAFSVLLRASNTRNLKLKDVAAAVIASISGSAGTFTYFDE
ncbi:ANTAR/GAF domain-containing protein [Pseudarthrobacter phenanthrenivorans Sphe3]|uniref:ANTAR/GAF domain-containing protein n=1 Tax=Pseudarthrobacter phenanthrenivorans (strain DSM 18606 / JCM 16027 / LMG 23796 / Sphe3) TaxID=930171 RepID=F0M8Q7_PSEPM|nr:GAF and ANTAR domain-containing protein [Pseudarthrobacter phenanthrenivorans]ADX71600.1 ANTAR/GAF domain-containing protein [Pseudarthrobacter phenanthrenivorans Sphe3]